ncbi:unnamed protein product [Toxocara canis]|uniref:Dynein light chain n=1 Tax=Toxocara canis TaxID=6265 RepID=A0A183UC38_TOXCA|nr:unnamed protein product [Toxocara canis]
MSPVEEDRGLLRRSQREEVSEGDGCEDIPDFESLAESPLPPIDPEGKIWRERTSTVPATRHDVAETQERFELELRNRKAKPFGICPIRRDIYDQLFDELIRQVSVNCAERGLMLLRVRDELRLTLFSYEHVLESAIAYGIRKSITTQQQQTTAVVERDRLHEQNKQLLAKVTDLLRAPDRYKAASEPFTILNDWHCVL